jgi:hypothetical protein
MILHKNNFVKIIIVRPKNPKLIPKIKCIMFVEQLYCKYYNIRFKSAPKGGPVMFFDPKIMQV